MEQAVTQPHVANTLTCTRTGGHFEHRGIPNDRGTHARTHTRTDADTPMFQSLLHTYTHAHTHTQGLARTQACFVRVQRSYM